jgi:hypothetical protein
VLESQCARLSAGVEDGRNGSVRHATRPEALGGR